MADTHPEHPPSASAMPRPRLRDPIQFAAFGFGAGLSPVAPGTLGTLVALPIYYYGLSILPLWQYSLLVLAAAILGCWICAHTSRMLGVHDHPGIVWDEFVGLWIALWALPADWIWILLGFVTFRIFDIAKPWPISWLDRHASGGFGIMIDDIVAGVAACATLHVATLLVAAS